MNNISAILPYIQIALSVLLILGVLMQQSSSGLGGAFGEDNNFGSGHHTRRGAEKIFFNGTVIIGILFVLSALIALAL